MGEGWEKQLQWECSCMSPAQHSKKKGGGISDTLTLGGERKTEVYTVWNSARNGDLSHQ